MNNSLHSEAYFLDLLALFRQINPTVVRNVPAAFSRRCMSGMYVRQVRSMIVKLALRMLGLVRWGKLEEWRRIPSCRPC
jgi:hypothetical protein